MARFKSDTGRERDEILSRLSPAFLRLFEFVREQKLNQMPGTTITQTAKEVKTVE
jgi:hypothetical protein